MYPESLMRGDSHVRFGKGQFRVILTAYFHHYTPNIELAFSSVEYIMRDSAGYSVFFYFFIFLFCSTSFVRVFQTLLRKPLASREQFYYADYLVIHKPLAISEYQLCLWEMSLNCLKPAVADLQANFWLWLNFC